MKRHSHITIGLISVLIAVSSALSTAPAFARHRVHKHHAARAAIAEPGADTNGARTDEGPMPGPQGPFAGAGGIFSPEYEAPGGEIYHLGGQILGGEFGKAYEDYYRHYYYYKYAYCPLGSKYVIYLRRCVGPFDLFR